MNETRIDALRRERGWTQEKLADESGVAVRTIQRLEGGHDASLETLSLIAKALQVPVRELFGQVEDTEFGAAVDGLDVRTATQQRQRDATTRGWRNLYYGIGLLLTFAAVALVSTQIWPGIGMLVVPAYWAAGYLLTLFLLHTVLDPRLDTKYPLSHPTRRSRSVLHRP